MDFSTVRRSEPFTPKRIQIALAIFFAFGVPLLFSTQTSSTAVAPQRRAQQQQQRGRRRSARPQPRTLSQARNYPRFLHASHRPPVSRLDCANCHTITSPTARDTIAAATKPSVKGFPYHDSCVGCHRQQFFRGANPSICTVCHTRSSPRLTRRDMHSFPKESAQLRAREFPGYFPHELHQSLIAKNTVTDNGARIFWNFAHPISQAINNQRTQAVDNCATCHGQEARSPALIKVGGTEEVFKPVDGTFKTVPAGHAACFNCHWQSQPPTKDDCAGCHLSQSELVKRKRAASVEAPLPGLLSPNAAQWFKTWPREWPKRLSIKFRHQTENHDVGCTTCHINITQMQTLNIPKADVPITTCAPCHISASPVLRKDGVNLTIYSEMSAEEKDADNMTNICIGCHTSLIGRERPPCSHYLILGQTCKE